MKKILIVLFLFSVFSVYGYDAYINLNLDVTELDITEISYTELNTTEIVDQILESVEIEGTVLELTDIDYTDLDTNVISAIVISSFETDSIDTEEAFIKLQELSIQEIKEVMVKVQKADVINMNRFNKAYQEHVLSESEFTENMVGGKGRSELMKEIVNNPVMKWWDIKLNNVPELQKFSIPDKEYKAVSDLTVPSNEEQYLNQLDELQFFKSHGYNTAMIVWKGETDLEWLEKTLRNTSSDWNFIFAPALSSDIYIDPEIYMHVFETVIPYCDFAISGWYGMSNQAHWSGGREEGMVGYENRVKYIAVMTMLMREVDPEFPIIGESWFWNHADDQMLEFHPDYADGSMLVNAGHLVKSRKPKPDGFHKLADGEPQIVLLTGGQPYHNNPEKDFPKAQELHTIYTSSDNYKGTIFHIGNVKEGASNMCTSNYHEIFDE